VFGAMPGVKQLYGQNPLTIVVLVAAFVIHSYFAYHFSQYSWLAILLGSYTVGAWISFILQVMGHEGTHRLVSKIPAVNKLVAVFAFLPIFTGPFGTLWMYEHMWHHNVVVDKSLRYGVQSNPALKKAFFTLIFIGIINIMMAFFVIFFGLIMLVIIPLGIIGL
jgi:fatty acid desaturase